MKKEDIVKTFNSQVNIIDDKKIDELYNEQRNHFKMGQSAQFLSVENLVNELKDYEESVVLGIDLPLWIDWNTDKPKLMIIGRDPQRNAQTQKGLIIGSPYSLVSDGGRKAKNNYWKFIEPLTEENKLYITDIYKLFISNSNEKVTELRGLPIHFNIFKDEIDLINPDKIITIGKDAADAVKKFIETNKKLSKVKIYEDLVYEVTDIETNSKITIYFIPHISGQVTSGIVTIANLYKSIGKLKNDCELQSVGNDIIRLKDKLFIK